MPTLEQLKALFKSYVWKHLLSMVPGLMLLRGTKTLAALRLKEGVATLSLSRTLNSYPRPPVDHQGPAQAPWPSAGPQACGLPHPRRYCGPQAGEKPPGVGFHFCPSQGRVVQGWDLVFAAVRIGHLTVPWDWRGYVNERFCEDEDFRKRTELVSELVRIFEPPVGSRVIVVVDSTYCCKPVIETAVARGFTVIGWVKKDRLLADGRRAWDVLEETIAYLQGLEIPVKIVHRGRGKGRQTVICTDLELGRQQILRHLKRRWGVEVMFRMLKEHFGLGDCRCRGKRSLERWVELVLLAYVLAGLTRWGRQLMGQRPSWGEVRQEWGWSLIQTAAEVRGWLATLGRLLGEFLQLFPPSPSPSPRRNRRSSWPREKLVWDLSSVTKER